MSASYLPKGQREGSTGRREKKHIKKKKNKKEIDKPTRNFHYHLRSARGQHFLGPH